MKRIVQATLSGLLLGQAWFSNPLQAQDRRGGDWNYRVEVFGDVARGGFYNGHHNWGKGLDYGGGVGVRPFSGRLRGLGFEVRTARLASESDSAVLPAKFRSSLVAANGVYHFRGRSRAQAYVLGGVGVVSVAYSRSCYECVFNVDPATGKLTPIPWTEDIHATKAGINLGAGLKIAVHRRVSIRPEILFVDTTPGSGWNWAWLRVQMGIGFHL
jgi:opacity protein-like surface antigen